ncbi:MAG: IS110 family transposase [bacterium]|nr:IS110 family transposase [bacterium]
MIYVGIDWADQSHSLCIVDEAGKKLHAFEIPHGQAGFEIAHGRIAKYAPVTQDAPIAIETKDSLIVDFFLELGYSLYFLNPKQTDRFRDRHRMSSSKSDGFDAYVLADALRTDRHLFNALSPLDEHSLKLRVLTRTREGLVQRKVAISNELTAALKRYFPVALGLFNGLDTPEAISFLLQYPTYDQARTVSQPRIHSILKKAGLSDRTAEKRAQTVYSKLKDPQPTPAPSIVQAYPVAVSSLLRQMRGVLGELEAVEEQIRIDYKDHPNKNLLESLPGIASTLGSVLAAELGSDITRFSDVKTLKAFAGSSPVTERSGKYCNIKFRRACNRRVRQALHLASQSAITCCPWARELYDRLRSQGKSYGRALRAVACQLIEILYVVLLRRTPYSEEYHLRMRTLHSKPTLVLT